MGVIAGMADRVQVMRHGEVVEEGASEQVFAAPRHDYTKMLLAAVPRLDRDSWSATRQGRPTAGGG